MASSSSPPWPPTTLQLQQHRDDTHGGDGNDDDDGGTWPEDHDDEEEDEWSAFPFPLLPGPRSFSSAPVPATIRDNTIAGSSSTAGRSIKGESSMSARRLRRLMLCLVVLCVPSAAPCFDRGSSDGDEVVVLEDGEEEQQEGSSAGMEVEEEEQGGGSSPPSAEGLSVLSRGQVLRLMEEVAASMGGLNQDQRQVPWTNQRTNTPCPP